MEHFNLNFSGDKNSWFDLWHYHPDNDGYGNNSPEQRFLSLHKLLDTYNHLKFKLQEYPHPYQVWILICENDSREDAVYIHTNNPNSLNFPLIFNSKTRFDTNDLVISEFIAKVNMEVFQEIYDGDKYFYLYHKDIGLQLL